MKLQNLLKITANEIQQSHQLFERLVDKMDIDLAVTTKYRGL